MLHVNSDVTGAQDMGFTDMMEIQYRSIPFLLQGRDILAAAKTGRHAWFRVCMLCLTCRAVGRHWPSLCPPSSFSASSSSCPATVPWLHTAKCHIMCHVAGTGVLVIAPTRELALQIFGVAQELLKYHNHTFGTVIGGVNR